MRFDFPAGIPCTSDLLGVRSRVALPSIDAQLCLPVEGERKVGFDGMFRAPRLRRIRWFEKVDKHFGHDDWREWGSYYQSGSTDADLRGVIRSAVLMVTTQDVSDDGLNKVGLDVHKSIHDWYLRLRDWLEVLTRVDLGEEHRRTGINGVSEVENPVWIAGSRVAGQRGYSLIHPPITIVVDSGDRTVDRASWQRAVREANGTTTPADAHLLLRDARATLARGQFRRCVLDAATAVEIVLSPLLAGQISKALGQAAAKELVPDNAAISLKIKALRKLGTALPVDLQSGLFTVRNKAIHRASEPTRAEARDALDLATTVVSGLQPL